MHKETGIIKSFEDWDREKVAREKLVEIQPDNLPAHKQVILRKRGEVKIGRNDPCPCGSGKKFKRCCLTPPPEVNHAPQ